MPERRLSPSGRPLLGRAPRARHRPHRLQGRLAEPLADRAGRPGVGLRARRPDRPVALRAGPRRRARRARRGRRPRRRARRARRSPGLRPEIVLHLAAQPLVRRSFRDPRRDLRDQRHGHRQRARGRARAPATCASRRRHARTSATRTASGRGATARTSRWAATTPTRARRAAPSSSPRAYRALVLRRRRRRRAVASARAGNVIGGGDWGEDRLMPDIMRAALAGEPIRIRNPERVRPWQHVLNPLSGYLRLAAARWSDRAWPRRLELRPAPTTTRGRCAGSSSASPSCGPAELRWEVDPGPHPHEAHWLKLDSSKARARLGWTPRLGPRRRARADRRVVPRLPRRRRRARGHARADPGLRGRRAVSLISQQAQRCQTSSWPATATSGLLRQPLMPLREDLGAVRRRQEHHGRRRRGGCSSSSTGRTTSRVPARRRPCSSPLPSCRPASRASSSGAVPRRHRRALSGAVANSARRQRVGQVASTACGKPRSGPPGPVRCGRGADRLGGSVARPRRRSEPLKTSTISSADAAQPRAERPPRRSVLRAEVVAVQLVEVAP